MYGLNAITQQVIDSAFRIHLRVGPGLLETVYESILASDLARKGLRVDRQKWCSFEYDGMRFANAFRPDLLLEQSVVVEVKSAPSILHIHEKQLLTYLRLLDCRVGLVLNFGAPLLRDGIRRVVNGF